MVGGRVRGSVRAHVPYVQLYVTCYRLSRLIKDTKKENQPQDISRSIVKILMPFHPPLNHDVYNHMEKIQPIL